MALDFIASGDEIDCGTDASAENLDFTTMMAWILNHSAFDGVFNFICTKGIAGTGGQIFAMSATGGPTNASLVARRETDATFCQAISTGDVGLDATEEWFFIAGTLAPLQGDDALQKLYTGSASTLVTEVGGYASQLQGTGAEESNAGESLLIGNRPAGDRFLEGRVGFVHWVGGSTSSSLLSEAEIRAQQFRPFVRADSVLFMLPGWDGTGTQADYSGNGNTGTVTGAGVVDGPPISPIFGWDPEWAGAFTAAVAGGRIMSSLARDGGLAGRGGIAGQGGGLAA